jgi:hypothetical protein
MKPLSLLADIKRYFLDVRFILSVVALVYIATYFNISATPGNAPLEHPLGWWGWFDQGKYLLSANAIAQGDLSPDKHFYPPLYPALGAIFLNWSSGHMYFVLNLVALLWFAYVFIRFSERYIARWGSIFLLFGTTIFNHLLFENYVIPWTSTLSVALLASGILGLVWLDEIRDGIRHRISELQVLFIALCLGMIVPTRPADAVVGSVIGLGLSIGYWSTRRDAVKSVPPIGHFLLAIITGAIVGPLFFFGFNIIVFDSPSGNYMQAASANGFFPSDIAEKFISLWLDGSTLYGERGTSLTEHYPWLFISLAGLVWVLIRGDRSLKSVALAIVLLFALYLPYGDLLPNGLWRYLNIHYFKWTFPFLALFAVLLVKNLVATWSQKREWALPSILLIGIPLLLLSLHLVIDTTPVVARITNSPTKISFELPNKQIDLIDINGLTGEFTDTYFGSHRLLLDGNELKRIRDYRLLPMNYGVRLLFIRPIEGHKVDFFPDPKLTQQVDQLNSQLGIYHFSLGVLKPFREIDQHELVTDYRLGNVIDFSPQGSGRLYARQGWSEPEVWGRWSVNDEARIQLHTVDHINQSLELELVINAFVAPSHPCQKVDIFVNKKEVARQSLCSDNGGDKPSPYRFKLTKELLPSDGNIDILFVTPDSISPKSLTINKDNRILGIGIKSLRIIPVEN